MIKINYISAIPYAEFDQYKKYIEARGMDRWDSYWLTTDDWNDLWQPTVSEEQKLNDPQMIMAYADGELCEESVETEAEVIPIIGISVINDPAAEEYLLVLGNKIGFADISWTVCNYNVLVADETIGKTIYNKKENGFKYAGSVLESYLNRWLDQHRNDPIKIPRER